MIDQLRDMILDLQRRVAVLEAMLATPQIIVNPTLSEVDTTNNPQQPDDDATRRQTTPFGE